MNNKKKNPHKSTIKFKEPLKNKQFNALEDILVQETYGSQSLIFREAFSVNFCVYFSLACLFDKKYILLFCLINSIVVCIYLFIY